MTVPRAAINTSAVPFPGRPSRNSPKQQTDADWRLHRHADYQRVYKGSRKQFSARMAYFVAPQTPAAAAWIGNQAARVGITAGRVLGNAVERNRIKRRMRAAIRAHYALLPAAMDLVLHPRRSVLEASWAELSGEVKRIFTGIRKGADNRAQTREHTAQPTTATPAAEPQP